MVLFRGNGDRGAPDGGVVLRDRTLEVLPGPGPSSMLPSGQGTLSVPALPLPPAVSSALPRPQHWGGAGGPGSVDWIL